MTEHLNTEEQKHHCPYCGALIHLVVEVIEEIQSYTEDCEVCCQPMVVNVNTAGAVEVIREDESFS